VTAIALTGGEDTGVHVPAIHSERLDLVSLSAEVVEALLEGRLSEAEVLLSVPLPEGWPDADVKPFLRLRLEQMRRDAGAQRWLVRALVRRSDGTMVGHAGFHGPPGTGGLDPGKAELGYTVFPAFRGQGFAFEAALALIDWAEGEGIHRFVASVGPWNAPSLAIVRKLGFVQTGEQWDEEDGLELVFELDRST
jgi:RimJ/RimL family protein N-acetyltransferase